MGGILTKLVDDLQSSDGISLDLTVVGLHEFQICGQSIQLRIKQVLQEVHILSFVVILIKNVLNVLDLNLLKTRYLSLLEVPILTIRGSVS